MISLCIFIIRQCIDAPRESGIFFSDNTKVRIFIFFVQNLTLGYMTKTLNHIIFFPPPKSEYFFQHHWESEYFF
jgi:hypothetical protein